MAGLLIVLPSVARIDINRVIITIIALIIGSIFFTSFFLGTYVFMQHKLGIVIPLHIQALPALTASPSPCRIGIID